MKTDDITDEFPDDLSKEDIATIYTQRKAAEILHQYFNFVDQVALTSQDPDTDFDVAPAPILIGGALTFMVNLFTRIADEDVEAIHADLKEMLETAPATAQIFAARAKGQTGKA